MLVRSKVMKNCICFHSPNEISLNIASPKHSYILNLLFEIFYCLNTWMYFKSYKIYKFQFHCTNFFETYWRETPHLNQTKKWFFFNFFGHLWIFELFLFLEFQNFKETWDSMGNVRGYYEFIKRFWFEK